MGHAKFEAGLIGDGVDAFGSTLTKPNVVGMGYDADCGDLNEFWLMGIVDVSWGLLDLDDALFFRTGGSFSTGATFLLFAMGNDRPRSFPLLATPTPQVNVVLYPEQSFPLSKHWVQYGRRRSH